MRKTFFIKEEYKMNNEMRTKIALFRFGLISNMVTRTLKKGELADQLRIISSQKHINAFGEEQVIAKRTLERYIQLYRQGGFDALKPSKRATQTSRAIREDALSQAIALKKERPERSVEQIIRILELAKVVQQGEISESTLSKQLRKRNLTKKKLKGTKSGSFRRFEFPYRNACWQGDVQHTLYLPNPNNPEKRITAKLITFLDDYSRLVVHGEFYFQERGPQLEDCFQKAMLRHGKPEQIYVDNGAIYRADVLKLACARLGIKLSHSKAGRPEGRGKLERFFQFVDSSFKVEAYDLIESGKIETLEELNNYFQIWLDSFYHERRHGETKQTPKDRFEENDQPLLYSTLEELKNAFLWEEKRKVDKTGCISFQNNKYEVETALAGQEVILRYDPINLAHLGVWREDTYYGEAVPLKVHRTIDKRMSSPDKEIEEKINTKMNYLELMIPEHERKKKEQLGKLSYSSFIGGENK